MRSLTIEAQNRQTAQALYSALGEFHPKMIGSADEGYAIKVELGGSDRQVVTVLDAIQNHISERGDGPAHVELDGHSYNMHPNA